MSIQKARIVFFVPEWPASNSAILESHVLSIAKLMAEHGCSCLFIGCDSDLSRVEQANQKVEKRFGIRAVLFIERWLHMGYPGLYITAASIYRKSLEIVRDFKPTHVYARSAPMARFARKFATQVGCLSVFDVRGILAEERRLKKSKKGIPHYYLLHLESREYRKADKLICVSRTMKEHFRLWTGRGDAVVIPSCFDENIFSFDEAARTEIRRRLGVEDDHWIICYSGGFSQWQRIGDIIGLFADLAKRDQRFRLLFLTKEKEKLLEMLHGQPSLADRCAILGCSQHEVYRYLSAADAGIIMRHDTIVNKVSSPIKIGEYLACGLPLIYTNGIGDFGDLIASEGVGLKLNEKKDQAGQIITFMKNLNRVEIRQSAAMFAQRYFAMGAHAEKYKNIFRVS